MLRDAISPRDAKLVKLIDQLVKLHGKDAVVAMLEEQIAQIKRR